VKEMLPYRRIVALVGAILFVLSAALPIAANVFGSLNLFDIYSFFFEYSRNLSNLLLTPAGFGLLLSLLFYPIGAILGFIGIVKRRIAWIAGFLALLSQVGTVLMVGTSGEGGEIFLQVMSMDVSFGVFIGFAGAIIILIAAKINPGVQQK
jgi:hypothetical protein